MVQLYVSSTSEPQYEGAGFPARVKYKELDW